VGEEASTQGQTTSWDQAIGLEAQIGWNLGEKMMEGMTWLVPIWIGCALNLTLALMFSTLPLGSRLANWLADTDFWKIMSTIWVPLLAWSGAIIAGWL
jgi:hypothetical protein